MARKIFTDESLQTFVDEIKAYTDESASATLDSVVTQGGVILPATNITVNVNTSGKGQYMTFGDGYSYNTDLVVGSVYEVEYDGTKYTCTAVTGLSYDNQSFVQGACLGGINEGYPFIIANVSGKNSSLSALITTRESVTATQAGTVAHTISISMSRTINPELIPTTLATKDYVNASVATKANTDLSNVDNETFKSKLEEAGVSGGIPYGKCVTAAGISPKSVTCPGFVPEIGAQIIVTFQNANTVSSPMLSVNGGESYFIYNRNKSIRTTVLQANRPYLFVFDGSYYRLLESLDVPNDFGTCSTSAGTVAKTVAVQGFPLIQGSQITVYFTNAITVANATLNVGSTGAKAIYYKGAPLPANVIQAKDVCTFVYDGTYWQVVGEIGDFASVKTMTTAEYEALEETNANTLYMLTDAEDEEETLITVEDIDEICGATIQYVSLGEGVF